MEEGAYHLRAWQRRVRLELLLSVNGEGGGYDNLWLLLHIDEEGGEKRGWMRMNQDE